MNQAPYPYRRELDTRYTFVSEGKKPITKVVEFLLIQNNDLYNLGFGDLADDGTIDDIINSNNGDLVKVIATVFKIIQRFTEEFPNATVYFTGSTPNRTRLYNRVIKTNYRKIDRFFEISALNDTDDGLIEVAYDLDDNDNYVAFFLTRLN